MSSVILNSKVSEDAKIYQRIRIVGSEVNSMCTVGDDSDLVDVVMEQYSEIGRRNIVRNTLIGKGSYTGTNTIIKNTKIGRYTSISWNVSVGGGNHNYTNVSLYTDYWYNKTFGIKLEEKKEEIKTRIGNDVWIGTGVIINSGIKIGDGCVIGAGSIITKDIEPYSIVIGIPGTVVKKRFSEEEIDLLQKIKWWEWPEDKIKKNINFLKNSPNIEVLNSFLKKE